MPGATETPDVVEGIQATLLGVTTAARADYYRVFMKIHGAEGDYTPLGSPSDPDFTLESLPVNSMIDIVVTAVNNVGESPVSQVVTVTTH